MEVGEIISVIVAALVAVGVIVSLVISLIKGIKKYKEAKTDAEREAALNDMANAAGGFIADVEKIYSYVKNSAPIATQAEENTNEAKPMGAQKKEAVMSKLAQYALEKGYDFNMEYYGELIDKIVALTNKVNVNKNN